MCGPVKTPTRRCILVIGVEVDLHCVGEAGYDRRLEVVGRRWIKIRVAAAVVHQGRPVPIGDFDKVARAGVDVTTRSTTRRNSKVSELKPQYLPTLHCDQFFFVKAVGIVSRVVG